MAVTRSTDAPYKERGHCGPVQWAAGAPPDRVQIGERGADFEAVQVLGKAPVADAKHVPRKRSRLFMRSARTMQCIAKMR